MFGSILLSAALLVTSVAPAWAEDDEPANDIATAESAVSAPGIPADLSATVYGSSIQLNWTAPKSSVPVFYTVAEKDKDKISDLEMPQNYYQTSYEVQSRSPGTYEFTVRAYTMDGTSPLYSEYAQTISVEVTASMKTVSMSSKFATIGIGETAAMTSHQGLLAEWGSSNPDVATVDHKGRVTGKQAGTAIIVGKTSALFAKGAVSCIVTVKEAPTSFTLPETVELGLNDPTAIFPDFGSDAAGGQVTYTIADPEIAVITPDGKLLPLKMGHTELTAKTFNGLESTTKLSVKKAPTSIEFEQEQYTIGEGEQLRLKAKLSEDSAANYSFSTADESIIRIGTDGMLIGGGTGETTITATTYNGLTADCTLVVKKAPNSVALEKDSVQLGMGGTYEISPVIPEESACSKFTYKSSDEAVASVSKGKVTANGEGTATITVSTYNGKSAELDVEVTKVKNFDKMLALTFDDGPYRPTTTKLLDALKERGIKATFFMVGNRIGDAPDLVQRMLDEGHELGNHSWDHSTLTANNTADQIGRTDQALTDACGQASTVFRSPYGAYDNDVLRIANKPQMYWSVDTEDWKHKDATYVKNYIIDHASDGAIILTHDIHETSVDGVIAALDTLIAQGYVMVTTSDLIARNGTPPAAGSTYFSEAKQ